MAVTKRSTDGSAAVTAQIRDYHAALVPSARTKLKALEKEVRAAAPGATRAFSYRIPAFALDGKILIWCAGWKQHVGMYPVTPAMEAAGGESLTRYRHAKGTLRFSLDDPLPVALIRRIIKARVREMNNVTE